MTRPREGQTFDGGSRLVRYVNFVKLPHTVFALPFALVGATLASFRRGVNVATLGWIVLAFTAARFAAMGFNRIVDRQIDARNPRTARRELPSGLLGVREASIAVGLASVLFVLAAWRLNPLCAALSPIALGWVLWYSYTKRFTHWSHIVLGVGLAIAPVGGYLAVAGEWSTPWWMLIALALGVSSWTAGFDILYSLQDEEFDRSQNLHSIPVWLGKKNALRFSEVLHIISAILVIVIGIYARFHWLYWIGTSIFCGMLIYQHSIVNPKDLSRVNIAFMTANGIGSVAFAIFVISDIIIF